MIESNLIAELPFLAVERILMQMVKVGKADRQECHERIRAHSQAAGAVVKLEGRPNDLVQRLKADDYFEPIAAELEKLLDPRAFIGRAPAQVYIVIDVIIRRRVSHLTAKCDLLF